MVSKAMFMEAGTSYVYKIYGIYNCFNISSEGEGAAVLIRAVEPLQGLPIMEGLRKNPKSGKTPKSKDLCNGPSRLCQALKGSYFSLFVSSHICGKRVAFGP